MRAELKGAMLRLGTAWWLTVNPSDQRNPLILVLVGVEFSHESMPALSATIRRLAVISRSHRWFFFITFVMPFLMICFDPGPTNLEFLVSIGPLWNGRGMFHIHSLVWLAGNFMFEELWTRVLNDPDSWNRLSPPRSIWRISRWRVFIASKCCWLFRWPF